MNADARFSPCRRYRYLLKRRWAREKPFVLFIGLNPSTADETLDDPTVRRCVGFARSWGYGGLMLANLFAFRSTCPRRLTQVRDPVGPENDDWLVRSARSAGLVVAAWGVHGTLQDRADAVVGQLPDLYCLGTTRAGAPRHPLYLSANTPLQPFVPAHSTSTA
ncbi:MAG: DUF1643 domain-containing protein [Phycisphaeraceae bacterium]|nr:DUF1643 domain-containing protein [Phycisphaeraceae bacterium]